MKGMLRSSWRVLLDTYHGAPVILRKVFDWNVNKNKNKNKAISVTGFGNVYVSEISRIPHCLNSRLRGGDEVMNLMHRPQFSPGNIFWYSFLL
jgi:hypothetical protein